MPCGTTDIYEDSQNVEIGQISQIEIYYPLNNNRYGKIYFVDGEQRILPLSHGYLTGNGNVQTFQLLEPIKTGRLSMRGINEDTGFEHTIDAWINILPIQEGDYIGF
jgi:hypothetical protein